LIFSNVMMMGKYNILSLIIVVAVIAVIALVWEDFLVIVAVV
jgi:hypothetical protein